MKGKFKRILDVIAINLLKALMLVILGAFVVFWVGACVGNFLSVDEDPASIIRWKP